MCQHGSSRYVRLICSNDAIQVRELCADCGANVRGAGANIPHREARGTLGLDIDALPVIADNRPGQESSQGKAAQEQELLF